MEISEAHILAVISLISLVVWLIRLEGKVIHQEKIVGSLQTKVETIDSELVKELTAIKVTLAKIEGYISHYKEQ